MNKIKFIIKLISILFVLALFNVSYAWGFPLINGNGGWVPAPVPRPAPAPAPRPAPAPAPIPPPAPAPVGIEGYSDYVPGIGVVIVQWAGFQQDRVPVGTPLLDFEYDPGRAAIRMNGEFYQEVSRPTFNLLRPDGTAIATNVSGTIDPITERGRPDFTFAGGQTIEPPTIAKADASVMDNSLRRAMEFQRDHPRVSALDVIIGLGKDPQLLAPDHLASIAEVLTVITRTDASLRGDRAHIGNPDLVWNAALRKLGGGVPIDPNDPALRGLTFAKLESWFNELGIDVNPQFMNALSQIVGNRQIVREDMARVADSLLAGQGFDDWRFIRDPRVDDPRVVDPRVDDPRVDDPRIDDLRPVCIDFYSDWPRIMYRQSSNLRWNCAINIETDRCVIYKDVGRVGNFVEIGEVKGAVGEKIVFPQRSTTYRLTCFRGNQSSDPLETTIRVLVPGLWEVPPGIQPQ